MPEIRDRMTEVGDRMSEVGDRMPEVGDRMPEVGDRMPEVGDRMPEECDRMPEECDRMPEECDRMPEVGVRMPEVGDRMPEVSDNAGTISMNMKSFAVLLECFSLIFILLGFRFLSNLYLSCSNFGSWTVFWTGKEFRGMARITVKVHGMQASRGHHLHPRLMTIRHYFCRLCHFFTEKNNITKVLCTFIKQIWPFIRFSRFPTVVSGFSPVYLRGLLYNSPCKFYPLHHTREPVGELKSSQVKPCMRVVDHFIGSIYLENMQTFMAPKAITKFHFELSLPEKRIMKIMELLAISAIRIRTQKIDDFLQSLPPVEKQSIEKFPGVKQVVLKKYGTEHQELAKLITSIGIFDIWLFWRKEPNQSFSID